MSIDFLEMDSQSWKHKAIRISFDISQFVELVLLIILVKKILISSKNDDATVKILKKSSSKSCLACFYILTFTPSFIGQVGYFFLPKWSARRARQTTMYEKNFWDICVFVVEFPWNYPSIFHSKTKINKKSNKT